MINVLYSVLNYIGLFKLAKSGNKQQRKPKIETVFSFRKNTFNHRDQQLQKSA